MTQRQIKLMKDLGTTVLCCTPSFAVYLAETMAKDGVNPRKDLKLRIGLFGAEPWSEKIRERIESDLGIEAFDVYGLTELCGPGVAYDAADQNGLYINEDHFLAEVVDPQTLEPLPEGEKGELIFTSLQRRAMAMIRYRTKDITRLWREPGYEGRTFIRMDKIYGRSDDMLIISGVNVFPSQIEALLLEIEDLALRACAAVGARLAGVDLLETQDGLEVLEVNTGGEFKGLMTTTDVDIAGAIVDEALSLARLRVA